MTSCSRVSWGGGVTQLVLKNNNPFYFNLSPVLVGVGVLVFKHTWRIWMITASIENAKTVSDDLFDDFHTV